MVFSLLTISPFGYYNGVNHVIFYSIFDKTIEMPMKYPTLIVIILTFLFTLWPNSACMEPEEKKPIEPDTTNHEFEWRVDTIGSYGYLYDVAIINENNIWVVGEFYTPDPDSSYNGTGWKRQNAAQWTNGKWIYHNILGGVPLKTIWVFNEADIWVSSGLPIHFDGNEWKLYHIQKMGVDASAEFSIWGSSSKNMYFGGGRGDLVHYDGDTFKKVEMPTDEPIKDIWGLVDSKGRETVYCVVTIQWHDGDRKIFELDGRNSPEEALNYPGDAGLRSIWFDDNSPVYVGGAGLYSQDGENEPWIEMPLKNNWVYSVRGNHKYDIFVVGYQLLYHYNGVDWHEFTNVPDDLNMKEKFKKVALKNNTVAIVERWGRVLIGVRHE